MRMTDNVCGIYLITNKINGHMYVGQSVHIYERWRQHCALYDLDNSLVEKAIAKYGAENFSFEIIITLENDTEKLNDAEREWIAILNTYEDKNHYNITPGGDFSPAKLPEVRAKISKAISGENNPMYGKKHTPETKAKISKANSGENNPMYGKKRNHSEDTRKKISKAISGENHPMYGKKLSEKTRKKMSEAKNTTGYYRVSNQKKLTCKQGFTYVYQYYSDDNKRHEISSVSLEKLEKKVKAKGLPWFRIGGDNNE